MYAALREGFRAAGVPVEFPLYPILTLAPRIVQLDVRITEWKGERIRLWRGAPQNRIDVLDADRRWGQVVLRVSEPRRRFQHLIPRPERELVDRQMAQIEASGSRFVREEGRDWRIESWTRGEERPFLAGYDEDHLFIAEIAAGATIDEAHAALKPDEVRDAERLWPGRVCRQGEWFFVPARPQEHIALGRNPNAIERNAPIQPDARPHVAAERGTFGPLVYVRGEVVHPDHATLHFPDWRRAVRNRAVVAQPYPGLRWID